MLSLNVPTEATVSTELTFRTSVQALFSLAKWMEDNNPDPGDIPSYEAHMEMAYDLYSRACTQPTNRKDDVLVKLQYVLDRVEEFGMVQCTEALERIIEDVKEL